MQKNEIKGKRNARKLALQALYQWQMAGQEVPYIEAQCLVANKIEKVNVDYFTLLLREIPKRLQQSEESLLPFLDRELTSLTPIELTVLRIGAFELLFCPELPYKVVLDEAVSLSKAFGSQDGYRYVNGVLNQLAKQERAIEIGLNP